MAVTAPGTHNPADSITIPTAWGDAVNADLTALDARVPETWTAYTPAFTATTTNPNLGNGGSITGRWSAIGKLTVVHINCLFGTLLAAAGLGGYRISLPVAAASTSTFLGSGMLYDSSAAQMKQVSAIWSTSTTAALYLGDAGAGVFEVTNAVPWSWNQNDQFWLNLSYEAA